MIETFFAQLTLGLLAMLLVAGAALALSVAGSALVVMRRERRFRGRRARTILWGAAA